MTVGRPAEYVQKQMRAELGIGGADRIGVTMDADEQLHPEQSTAAIVLHHPQARYFKV